VIVDNISICERVINRLVALGHNRIGILTPPLASITSRIDRVEGCRRALRDHGHELPPNLLVEVDFHKDSGEAATAKLLSQPSPPTALFVLNTFLAVGALKELEKKKGKALDEISFVMFDDPEWAELLSPRLTAVQQPIRDIGRAAARLVMERINQPEKAFENIRLEARLVERESIRGRKS
jgi:LacI family transcriptional regulator